MNKVAFRPAVLVLLFGLMAFTVRQVAAATIADLSDFYEGSTHSHLTAVNEDVGADFSVDTVNRSSFTGTFDDGGLEFEVRGTVSRTGRVTFSGKFDVPEDDTKLTIRGSGQLSATGAFFIGTATERGKLDGDNFRDSLSFVFQEAAGLTGAAESVHQPQKQH